MEDEVPEGFVEPQEEEELTNSLNNIIQNEEVKPKLQCIMSNPSFSTVTVQSEDSGITGETSSSRCSTPWASEASATSDLYSIESSSVESPQGQVIFLMDESKTVRKRMCKSSDRTLLPSDMKGSQGNKKSDLSGMQMQESRHVPRKGQDAKLNAAELEAQAMDAETPKDKQYLPDVTGEPVSRAPIASKPTRKENRLKKERPALNGAVSAKIQKFSLISEEATPKFFKKKSSKDPAMPADIKRKPKQQPKGLLNQSLSSPSLMHLKKDCPKDDGSLRNVKPVETHIESGSFSNGGVIIPRDKEERKEAQSSPAETLHESSEQSLSITSYLIDEGENQEIQPHSFFTTKTISTDSVNEPEEQTTQPDVPMSTESVSALSRSSHAVKETENQETQFYSPLITPPEPEHSVLSDTKKQDIKSYSPTTAQSECDHPALSYSMEEGENPEIHPYSPVTAQLECEEPDISYSTYEIEGETTQLDSEHSEQQDIQPHSPITTQSECDHPDISYSTEEAEEQEIQSYSPVLEQLEFENVDLSNPADETETQENECYSQVFAGLDSELSDLSYSIGEAEKQESSQLESEHPETHSILAHSALTAQLDSEPLELSHSIEETEKEAAQLEHEHQILSHSIEEAENEDIQPYLLVPEQLESEQLVLSETESEEIQLPLSKMENPIPEQSVTMSLMHTDDRDGQELQGYSVGTEYVRSEQLTAPSPTFIDEVYKQEMQPDEHEVPDLMSEVLNISAGSINEEEKHDIDSSLPDTEDVMLEQSNVFSNSCNKEADRCEKEPYLAGIEYTSYEQSMDISSDFTDETVMQENQSYSAGSKLFPGGLLIAHTAPSTNENKSDMTMGSDFVSNEASCTLLSEPINEIHTHNLYSSVPGNPVSDKNLNNVKVTIIRDLTKAEEKQHFSNVEAGSKEPEHYLSREETLTEEAKYTPEPHEQKDAFNIISEGYEILNIHAVPLIFSVDEEESKHMPDKLEYLETNTLIKTKPFDNGDTVADHEVPACGTPTEISENLMADDTRVKDVEQKVHTQEIVETAQEISTVSENESGKDPNPNESAVEMDYFEKYTLIDDKSPTEVSVQGLFPFVAVVDNPKKCTEETISSTRSLDNTLEDEFTLLDNDLDEAFYGMMEEESKLQSSAEAQKFLTMQKSIDSSTKAINEEDEQKLAGTPLFDTEGGVLERSMLFPTSVSAINPELLEEPPALAFLYKDLYAEAEGENTKGENEPLSEEESTSSDASFPRRNSDTDDETGIYFEKYILKDDIPCNVAESQKDQVSKDQSINKDLSSQLTVSEDKHMDSDEVTEEEHLCLHILSEESAKTEVLSEGENVVRETNPIISYIKVTICQPAHAIPFGSKFSVSEARNDHSSQREEENASAATNQELSEQMSHEESSQVLDAEVTANQQEASVQDKSKEVFPPTDQQKEQHEIVAVNKMENYMPHGRAPVDESESNQYGKGRPPHVNTLQQPEELISYLKNHIQPMKSEAYDLEHDHPEILNKKISQGKYLLDTDEQTSKKSVRENIINDIAKHESDKASGELDLHPFRHDLHTLQPDSRREEQCFEADEDLAESMDYEVITQEELLQDERSSELAHEDLLLGDGESFEQISYIYEFENEEEGETTIEHEDSGFVMVNSEKSSLETPESESSQKESKKAHIDTYCYQCRCPISAIDKLFGEHEAHDVTTLDTAIREIKDKLDGLLGELQQRSVKTEELVSEIESLFNSVEENSKKNEQFLEDQNEEMVSKVLAQYDEKSRNFEEAKKMKMEYLYEQMVNFQQSIVSAKETLETTVKEIEELDDVVFLNLSKEINKRLLSAMDSSLSLEKMPSAFSLFDHYADSSERSDQKTLKCVAVPQTPKLIPQEPNSATSTSIAVYWTVSEGDVIDCFQVYCMEEPQANQDQNALVEEYRVIVKESYCILEDLEPDRYYGVWVMAVNYTGCSLPTDKSIFKTAPSTPLLKAEDCTVCWDTAIIRWSTANSEATKSFTLEYCRQYSPEGEGLRSFAGIKKPELEVTLQPNVNYFFYVRAVNSSGTSDQSEAALISTKGTRFHVMSDTAHPALQVLANGTVICLPERTKFSGIPSVLGELLPARGQHYWETTVTGCKGYRIGVCYNSTPQGSILGQDDTSWCICCCSTETSFIYKFFHCGVMSDVYMTEQPARVGLLLDYNGGTLSFFNAERGLVLFTTKHRFTNAAHPAFVLEKAGVLNLHTGMELPEFVKHS
nr:cardiomyopathy-associated protein 5 isoform X1 [Pelodiscus sinensis]|eukprot:XP_006119243.1 cardiomyopathy-associated protein 5 isoform X1 [Pelodiscus sinensis]